MEDRPLHADADLRPGTQQTPRSQRPEAQTTVGFLAANIHVGASRMLWRGVVDAAERHGVNLVCFPGGDLRTSDGVEAQRNVIYDLVEPARMDGLISWSSTITESVEPADIRNFHQRYRSLPVVSLAQPV